MFLLIVYDITDDRRRLKVDKTLSSYGVRVNYSVFEVVLTSQTSLLLLRDALVNIIEIKKDSLRIYHLGKKELVKAEELGERTMPFVQKSGYVS